MIFTLVLTGFYCRKNISFSVKHTLNIHDIQNETEKLHVGSSSSSSSINHSTNGGHGSGYRTTRMNNTPVTASPIKAPVSTTTNPIRNQALAWKHADIL